jgi:hypothetical protein
VPAVTSEAGADLAGPVMDPAVTTKRTLPPDRLGSRITQTSDAYVIGHLGIARVQPQADARNQIHSVSIRVHQSDTG